MSDVFLKIPTVFPQNLTIPIILHDPEYRYRGIWIDEILDPMTHMREQAGKIKYLLRLKVKPKKYVSPKLIINIWSMIIHPIFDYGVCFARLLENSKINWYET